MYLVQCSLFTPRNLVETRKKGIGAPETERVVQASCCAVVKVESGRVGSSVGRRSFRPYSCPIRKFQIEQFTSEPRMLERLPRGHPV